MPLVRSYWEWFCSRFLGLQLAKLSRSEATVHRDTAAHWLADGWQRRWSWLIQMRVVMALTERPGSWSPKKTQARGGFSFKDLRSQTANISEFSLSRHHMPQEAAQVHVKAAWWPADLWNRKTYPHTCTLRNKFSNNNDFSWMSCSLF